jgi:methyl-accepting chemotaxis protein
MGSITGSLRFAIIVLIVLLLGVGGVAWYGQQVTERAVAKVTDIDFPGTIEIDDIAVGFQRARRYEKELFVFAGDKERATKYSKDWDGAVKQTADKLAAMTSNRNKYFSDAEVSKAREWEGAMKNYTTGFDRVRNRVLTGAIDGVAANAENGVNVDFVRPFDREAPAAAAARLKTAKADSEKLKDTIGNLRNVMLSLVALIIAYLIYLAISLPKRVAAPLALISDAVDRMSKGDLKTELEAPGVEEFEKLL